MAKITPTQNTSSQNQDPVVLSTSTTAQLKRAVNATALTPTGSDYPAAAQMVGTHVDDAAFTAATDPLVAVAGLADETAPDSVDEGDIGALRMTLDRMLRVVSVQRSSAATKANVAGSASSVTILAANVLRRGASVWNDSTAILYLDLTGGTASATSCSVKLIADAFYEVPFGYTGLITGIWASATGAARVTEFGA